MRPLTYPKLTRLKLPDSQYNHHIYWLFLTFSSVSILLLDIYTPLGVATGTLYALIVFATIWFKSNSSTYIAATLGIIFTVLGFFLSASMVTSIDIVLINRLLAFILISVIAYMVLTIKKVNHELYSLINETHVDPLTQCKNERAFIDETKTEIKRSKRYKRALSLAIFDITGIGTSNPDKRQNIPTDNQHIKTLADEIRKSIRSSDQLYRIEHNRFVVLYVETDICKAEDASDALCKKFSRMNQSDNPLTLSVSVGITMLDEKDTLKKFYKRAEDALQISVENGSNQVATLPETYRTGKSRVPAILSRPRSS